MHVIFCEHLKIFVLLKTCHQDRREGLIMLIRVVLSCWLELKRNNEDTKNEDAYFHSYKVEEKVSRQVLPWI